MCYQGCGLNGADGLGLRLKLPKGIKRKVKKLGRKLKSVVRSPIFKGAVIGAAGGLIYKKIRSRKKLADLTLKAPRPGTVPIVRTPTTFPSQPIPYIEPPNIPVGPSGVRLPPATGGPTGGPSMRVRQIIAEKIMSAIPLSAEEMAIVQAGWLGEGMKAAAEAAYGSDAYIPGAGQPLGTVTITGTPDDNRMLYAGLGLAAVLLLGSQKKRTRRRRR